ncbi:MAG: carbon-nitrogen hydrolase family protein [Rhodospirillales bacterium]|nr:carbon-nitrogen hydrolase family protein [Rhodospirillales bacterium]
MKAAKVAAVQVNIRHLATRDNVARHLDLIDEAKARGASLVLFPELSATGHNGSPEVVRDAEPADGPIFATIARRAAEREMFVSYGFAELNRGTHYNTQALVGPDGLVGLQRKTHASYDEFFVFRQAYEWAVYDLGFARVATAICHDSDFFESWRVLALMGAEIVLLPHAIRKMNAPDGTLTFDGADADRPEMDILAAQRELLTFPSMKFHDVMARTNCVYGMLSDHVGFDGHSTHVGGAYILGPDGLPKAATVPSLADQMIVADLDPALFERARTNPWFQLRKRRPEIYGELSRTV